MNQNKKIRVLVVDDSITIQNYLIATIHSDLRFEVVGKAENGQRAIELCQKLRPDVITLDMVMPMMSGLAVTEFIMAFCPTPILIVSSSINRGNLYKTYEALAAGAVDVISKLSENESDEAWENFFRATLHVVSRIKVITHPNGRMKKKEKEKDNRKDLISINPKEKKQISFIAIGASTGGPAAVLHILNSLPSHFPIPILLIIHIGEQFETSLTDWLDSESPFPVRCIKDGEMLPTVGIPQVIMAPPKHHMIIKNNKLVLTSDPERNFCRPSIDVLFESVANELGEKAIGCLLTGMGRDGAQGLLAMRKAGALTIAQDEATSVVYGMPREAAELDAAQFILALNEIASTLLCLTTKE